MRAEQFLYLNYVLQYVNGHAADPKCMFGQRPGMSFQYEKLDGRPRGHHSLLDES